MRACNKGLGVPSPVYFLNRVLLFLWYSFWHSFHVQSYCIEALVTMAAKILQPLPSNFTSDTIGHVMTVQGVWIGN